MKLAVVCRYLNRQESPASVQHSIIHTGQHYDREMSALFFSELEIPEPDFHLGVGSGTHGAQTGEMIKQLEPVLANRRPDCVLLYGDTNSTLAGAVVCAKLGIPTAHVEAGLRSFNRRMPEEINRVVADHLCDLLFCPTAAAAHNLDVEGLSERAILTGDVMYDAALYYRERAEARGGPLAERFKADQFALATIHRAENTDDPERLRSIITALESIARSICPVVFPMHPRTRKYLEATGTDFSALTVLPPVSYLDMLLLENRARFIVTDSGGVQKEAYFLRRPCVTARDETEWVETLENGCNVLAGADTGAILAAAERTGQAGPWSDHFGTGNSCEIIIKSLRDRIGC